MAGLLCVLGAAAWLQGLPQLRARLQTQQQAVQSRQAALQARGLQPLALQAAVPAQGLAVFYEALGESRFAEQQLKTMFVIAGDLGLPLDQAEYKSGIDTNGGFQTYQIMLPVKGSYAQLRQFCEQMLAAIPFASLDDMSLRRETIGDAVLQGRLRFTLYLAEPPPAALRRNAMPAPSVPHIP